MDNLTLALSCITVVLLVVMAFKPIKKKLAWYLDDVKYDRAQELRSLLGEDKYRSFLSKNKVSHVEVEIARLLYNRVNPRVTKKLLKLID